MPRKARIDEPGALHHIIGRGINRQEIFSDKSDYSSLLDRLGDLLVETRTSCYGWALMPNHLLDGAPHKKWLHKSFILSLFASDRREGINTYKKFILMESPEEIKRIFSQSKFPSMLGSENFINRVKEKFFHKKCHNEIPESRRLAPGPENIKKAICKACGIEESSLLSSRRGVLNEPRNAAIFLLGALEQRNLKGLGDSLAAPSTAL